MMQSAQLGALSNMRVIELSDRFGFYTGRLFAEMGADVVLVERPGGSSFRKEPPFIEGAPRLLASIPFTHLNANKRSIVLDLHAPADRDAFHELIATADALIEDMPPQMADELGLNYASLAKRNPKLVVTSITPYGRTGPYAHYAADDLSLLAMGGFLTMMGYPDMAPTQTFGSQAIAMGCSVAAVGTMMALLAAQRDGAGQYVDISIQQSVTLALENALQTYDLERVVRTRFAGLQRHAGTGVFKCRDGYIYLFAGGIGASRFWKNLVKWLLDEKVAGAELLTTEPWQSIPYLDTNEAKEAFNGIFPAFALTRTKEQFYSEGQARRVPIAPIATPAEVVANEQLQSRAFFAEVPHPGLGRSITLPGSAMRLSVTPGRISRGAPAPNEHAADILASLRTTTSDAAEAPSAGVR